MAEISSAINTVSMSSTSQEQAIPRLDDFVHAVLVEHGFNELPEEEQQRLLPNFTEQALVRLGAAIAPRLSPEGIEEFVQLSEDEKATPETWATFWKQNVPDFTTVAQTALEQYIQEIQVLMGA